MTHERMIDGRVKPTERAIAETIGSRAGLWRELREYLANSYEHSPAIGFDGPKYGWAIRYRRSGKTLLTLYPEHGSFTVLVVLGGDEVPKRLRLMPTS